MTQETDKTAAEFRYRAISQANYVRENLAVYPEFMLTLQTVGSVSRPVLRSMLQASFEQMIARHPAISIMEWVTWVNAPNRAQFERRQTELLGAPFVIRQRQADNTFVTAPLADDYYPIILAVPLAGNEQVIGYDLRSAPTIEYLKRARATRTLVATHQFSLAQASAPDDAMGIVLIMPVFSVTDTQPEPVFHGFIQCILRIQTALKELHSIIGDEALLLYFEDTSEVDPRRRVMYANLAGVEPAINNSTGIEPPEEPDPSHPHAVVQSLAIGGRDWRVIAKMNPAWAATQRTSTPTTLLWGGLLGTLLLGLLVNTILVRNREIERTVERRTADVVLAQKLLEKDITRRVIAEKSLRESEALLRSLLDNSTNEIFIKDIRGRYIMFNQEYQRSADLPASAMAGKTDWELFPPELAKKITDEDRVIIETLSPQKYETQLDLAGRTRTHFVQKFPIFDENGKIYAVGGIGTDISYRTTAEAERRELERKLQSGLRMESLGVLAGGIAHDFNNILTTILGNASVMQKKGGTIASNTEPLIRIETAARRAADLCEQMLTYAGQHTPSMELIDLNEIVRDTIVLLSVSLPKNIELPLDLAPRLRAVEADSSKLRQVVMNLIINAGDAIGDNSGRITIRTFERTLTATELNQAIGAPDLPAGDYLGIEFVDNGCGIDEAKLSRIFDPFFTTKFHGRGLGLSTVLGIMQSCRGALFVKSKPGQGTSFNLFLPATDKYVSPTESKTETAEASALSGTALVVDDEKSVLEVTVATLEMIGLATFSACSGAEALEIYKTHQASINIVLLDMTMPGLSGAETLKALREINPQVKAIILSGYTQADAHSKLSELEVAAFIQKPFEYSTLRREIAAQLAPS